MAPHEFGRSDRDRSRLTAVGKAVVPQVVRKHLRRTIGTIRAWRKGRSPAARAQRHLQQAQAHRASGDVDGALGQYQAAIRLTPDDAHAWAGLASTYNRAFDRDKALAAYRRAIDLEPDNPAWHSATGRVLAARYEDRPAIAHLDIVAQHRELTCSERLALIKAQRRLHQDMDARESVLATGLPIEDSRVGCELFATGLSVLLADGSDDDIVRWVDGAPRDHHLAHVFLTSMLRHLVDAWRVRRLLAIFDKRASDIRERPLIDTAVARLRSLHELRATAMGDDYDLRHPVSTASPSA